ncbi:MAG: hypothetical protein ACO38Y_04010 [Steroidobacteraceae bacterium]
MSNSLTFVTIHAAGACCQAALEVRQRRFTTSSVPMLPLRDCTMTDTCACKYLKDKDQRRGEDRRFSGHAFSAIYYSGPERRKGPRRREDIEANHGNGQSDNPLTGGLLIRSIR